MTTRRLAKGIFGLLLIQVLSTYALWAQFSSGIEGTVTDPSGALVPNATVVIKNLATGVSQSHETSTAGYYRFTLLPASVYELTATASGFKTTVQENIRLDIASVRTVNITLELGTATTEVTVTAAPPPVESSQGRVSGLIEQSKVEDLPLVGRNFFTLVVLTPGVTGLPSGGGQSYAQATGDIFTTEYGVALNANGQRGMSNNFAVDSGSTNNVAHGGLTNFSPNADSVQEVRVSTNNFSAESGRNSSVNVNTVTKQGTNVFHGTVSWFHTDNALQSRNIFQLPTGPVFRRNEGAWSFGGPILKDRTFFFGSMDVLRSGVGYGFPQTIATPEFINFMEQNQPDKISTFLWKTYPAAITPTSGFQTAGSILGTDCSTLASPSTPISSEIGPIPCNFNVLGNGNVSTTVPRNGFQWSARIDHMFNGSKDRLYGNFYRTTLYTVLFNSPNVYPAFTEPWHQYTQFFNLNETHTFSPTTLNEASFSYLRASGDNICTPCEVPGIGIQGMSGFGQGWGPGVFVQNIFEWRDVVTFNRGTHSLKAGMTLQHNEDYDDFGRILTRPTYGFLGVFDFANDKVFSEGNLGIDPKTGQPISSPIGYIAGRDGSISLFVQDDWKVKRNLTLNLGLRWEDYGCPVQRHFGGSGIIFQGGSDFQSRVANAKVDLTKCINQGSDTNNFAPRVSFAWDPTKEGKMSVRGGAGVFYNRLATGVYLTGTTDNPPRIGFVSVSQTTPPALPVYGLGTSGKEPFGFPTVTGITPGLDAHNGLLVGPANVFGMQPDTPIPYSFNWFFGVQRAFGNNWTLEADYIGSVAHRMIVEYDVNRFAGDLIENNNTLTRLNHSFGAMTYAQTLDNSAYTGGTLALKKRFTKGFSFDTAYTLGKAIDGSDIGGGGNEPGANIADPLNLRRERGLAVFDVRQRLAFSSLWQLPNPNSNSRILRVFLGGWQVGNVTILQSGSPYSVYCSTPFIPIYDVTGAITGNSGCDYNADGTNFDYPNTPAFGNFRSGSRSAYINGIFKASDFPAPALGQEGDLGRNTFIGPGYANTDFTVIKNTKIPWFAGKEGANLQFRTEIFNIFNRVNLQQVTGDLASPFFGESTSQYGSRDFQFGIRIAF
jgi:hypothetical protein